MFGERLKELRTEKNLTQKQLADKLVISKNSICEYEKGRSEPSIETLIKIADILDCPIDFLVGRTNEFDAVKYDFSFENDELFLLAAFRQFPDGIKKYMIETAEIFKGLIKK